MQNSIGIMKIKKIIYLHRLKLPLIVETLYLNVDKKNRKVSTIIENL